MGVSDYIAELRGRISPGVPYDVTPRGFNTHGNPEFIINLRTPGGVTQHVLATRSNFYNWYFSQRYADPNGITNATLAASDHVHHVLVDRYKPHGSTFRPDSVGTHKLLGLTGTQFGFARFGGSFRTLHRQAIANATAARSSLDAAISMHGKGAAAHLGSAFGRAAGDLRVNAVDAFNIAKIAGNAKAISSKLPTIGVGTKAAFAARAAHASFAAAETLARNGTKWGESAARLALAVPELQFTAAMKLAEAEALAAARAAEIAAVGTSKISEASVRAAFKAAEQAARAAAKTGEQAMKVAFKAAEATALAAAKTVEGATYVAVYAATLPLAAAGAVLGGSR